jgi:hypothetical protein
MVFCAEAEVASEMATDAASATVKAIRLDMFRLLHPLTEAGIE